VRDDDVADALTANRALQRRVRAVIREVEADLAANAEARAELADALRARRGKRGAGGFGNDANGGDHDYFAEVLCAMRPNRSYFRVLPGAGREKRRKTAFAADANVAADRLETEEDGGPRLNRDAARVAWREIRAAVPVSFEAEHKPWTEEDDARLRRGVHHYTQQARVFSRERLTLAEVAGVGAASLEALLDDAGGLASVDADADAIDWAEVCAVHLPRRDPADAKARWRNCRDPRLEQRAFDEAEDDRLARIAKRFGARDWPAIARALNDETRESENAENERERLTGATFQTTTNDVSSTVNHRKKLRSATQCAGRYQAFLNPDLVRSSWTEAEDAILRRHVVERGAGRWADAARALPGHTHQQALHRWTKVLCPGRRKGQWRPEEDEALRFAVAAHAAVAEAEAADPPTRPAPAAPAEIAAPAPRRKVFLPWSKIAARVATRTDVQCRERWTNVLDPARAAGKARAWTAAEDARLEAAVRRRLTTTRSAGDESAEAFETVVAWAQVARDMGDAGLTDKLCRNRHIILRRAAAKAAREAAKGAEKAAAKAAKAEARAAAKAEKAAAKAEARAAAKAEKAAAKAARATGNGGKRAGSRERARTRGEETRGGEGVRRSPGRSAPRARRFDAVTVTIECPFFF
jgi:myb proto-oncogene protein